MLIFHMLFPFWVLTHPLLKAHSRPRAPSHLPPKPSSDFQPFVAPRRTRALRPFIYPAARPACPVHTAPKLDG